MSAFTSNLNRNGATLDLDLRDGCPTSQIVAAESGPPRASIDHPQSEGDGDVRVATQLSGTTHDDRVRQVAAAFDAKAKTWATKGNWIHVLGGDDCPLDRALSSLALRGEVIIDVGGGDGRCVQRMAGIWPNSTFVVLEISRSMAALAVRRIGSLPVEHVVAVADASSGIPVPDRTCALVVLRQVLHHIRDPLATLCEVRRILAPEGYVAIQVPGPGFLHELSRYEGDHSSDAIGRFSPEEIQSLLKQAGFQPNVSLHPFRIEAAHIGAMLHYFQEICLTHRLVGYEVNEATAIEKFLRMETVRNLLDKSNVITVSADYVCAIAKGSEESRT